jgi:hypothetical protein
MKHIGQLLVSKNHLFPPRSSTQNPEKLVGKAGSQVYLQQNKKKGGGQG